MYVIISDRDGSLLICIPIFPPCYICLPPMGGYPPSWKSVLSRMFLGSHIDTMLDFFLFQVQSSEMILY